MRLGRLIVGSLTVLPILELAAFVLAAVWLGFGLALLLLLALSAAGGVLLSRAGRAQLAELRQQLSRSGPGAVELDAGRMVAILAGLLLLVPGFITGSLGLLLLAAPRRWRTAAVGRAARSYGPASTRPSVVDLDPGEWQVEPRGGEPHGGEPHGRTPHVLPDRR
jgi:UPF0716 protein FxsA